MKFFSLRDIYSEYNPPMDIWEDTEQPFSSDALKLCYKISRNLQWHQNKQDDNEELAAL